MTVNYKLSLEAKEGLHRIYHYCFKNWGEEQANKFNQHSILALRFSKLKKKVAALDTSGRRGLNLKHY